MAEKRMFSKKVTDSDSFIEMPSAAQALYFHLNQSADDDGFNNQVQLAIMKAHASVDDLKVLMLKNFVIRFESGVLVIKHWRIHNTLRRDRYTPTSFQEELAKLNLKSNQSYTLGDDGCHVVAERLPDGTPSIDKVSIDKVSIEDKGEGKAGRFTPPTLTEVSEYCKERNNGIDHQYFIDYYEARGWELKQGKMKNWKAAIRTWEKRNGGTQQPQKAKKYETVMVDGEWVDVEVQE